MENHATNIKRIAVGQAEEATRPAEHYLGMVMECLTDHAEFSDKNVNSELSEVVLNSIAGNDGPRVVETEPPALLKFIARKLFRGVSEIHSSRRCLRNISVYIRRFPYARQEISRVDYLQYNIEGFFHEIYIFKERLETYTKTIERAWRGSEERARIKSKMEEAREMSMRALSGIGKTRGSHVHQFRYSDEDTERLETLELLAKHEGPESKVYDALFNSAYKEIRTKWVRHIIETQEPLDALLDVYSQCFIDCISDGSSIVLPKKIEEREKNA